MYPDGAPINFEYSWSEEYSEQSIVIKFFLSLINSSANTLADNVFPQPVFPANKNEPIGLIGSFKPTLAL